MTYSELTTKAQSKFKEAIDFYAAAEYYSALKHKFNGVHAVQYKAAREMEMRANMDAMNAHADATRYFKQLRDWKW